MSRTSLEKTFFESQRIFFSWLNKDNKKINSAENLHSTAPNSTAYMMSDFTKVLHKQKAYYVQYSTTTRDESDIEISSSPS